MLLDCIMPFYHFKELHSIVMRARNKAIITAVKDITPVEIPFMFELLWLHSLPSRLFSTKKSDLEIVRKKPFFEQYLNSGFILLAEDESQELVLGSIAQFWKLINDPIPRIDNTQEFLVFNNPSYAKAAMNFYVHHHQSGAWRPGNHLEEKHDTCFGSETKHNCN
jgi:hypothetical protein